MVKSITQLYLETRQALLAQEDMQDASFIARNLICHVTGLTKEQILAGGEYMASEMQCEQIAECTKRILSGEPLAYVLGEWNFYGLNLKVNPGVLIPRDDTCAVAELAMKYARSLQSPLRILDLCTGTGCIGLAVAREIGDSAVILADISEVALAVANDNIAANNLTDRVSCARVNALDIPDGTLGKFDIIVSNPPYITSAEMEALPHSVKAFEPHIALYGGEDGLDFYQSISDKYRKVLKPGGYLCFEFGMGQGDAVCQILQNYGYTILERTEDYNQIERAVIAQWQEGR